MFKKILIGSTLVFVSTASFAQQAQQPDPAFLQRAINSLQTQRNGALDSAAIAEAKAAGLADDLAKANAKVKELEAKLNPPKPDKK